jgi:hypothetical protein
MAACGVALQVLSFESLIKVPFKEVCPNTEK